jgi:hypothetical protein
LDPALFGQSTLSIFVSNCYSGKTTILHEKQFLWECEISADAGIERSILDDFERLEVSRLCGSPVMLFCLRHPRQLCLSCETSLDLSRFLESRQYRLFGAIFGSAKNGFGFQLVDEVMAEFSDVVVLGFSEYRGQKSKALNGADDGKTFAFRDCEDPDHLISMRFPLDATKKQVYEKMRRSYTTIGIYFVSNGVSYVVPPDCPRRLGDFGPEDLRISERGSDPKTRTFAVVSVRSLPFSNMDLPVELGMPMSKVGTAIPVDSRPPNSKLKVFLIEAARIKELDVDMPVEQCPWNALLQWVVPGWWQCALAIEGQEYCANHGFFYPVPVDRTFAKFAKRLKSAFLARHGGIRVGYCPGDHVRYPGDEVIGPYIQGCQPNPHAPPVFVVVLLRRT